MKRKKGAPQQNGESKARLAMLKSIFEHSTDAILSFTFVGIITDWNPSAECLYGYSSEEIVGQHISLLASPENQQQQYETWMKIRDGYRLESYETIQVRKDGSEFPVSLAISPIYDSTGAGVSAGVRDNNTAADPATCGDAIDVPEIVFAAVVDVYQAEVINDPGANRSRHRPKFEYEARVSVLVVAPTVTACATRLGDDLQASAFELPAATTTVTPSFTTATTAASKAALAPPPRLMLTTAGPEVEVCCCTTQSSPAMTPEIVPEPAQLRTRTGTIVAFLATP